MTNDPPPRYDALDFGDLRAADCPCGSVRRAFAGDPSGPASIHIVEIRGDSRVHYHRRLTEHYVVLEGEGTLEADGDRLPLRPGSVVRIRPGCRHRATGALRVLNVVVPSFDPDDEWFDP